MSEFETSASLTFDDVGGGQLKRRLEETVSPITIEGRVEQAGGGSPAQQAVGDAPGSERRARREHRWQRENNGYLESILETLQDAEFGGGGGGLLGGRLAFGAGGVLAGSSGVLGSLLGGAGAAGAAGGLAGGAAGGALLGNSEVSDGIDFPGRDLLDPTRSGGLDVTEEEGEPLVDVPDIAGDLFNRPDWLDNNVDLFEKPEWVSSAFDGVLERPGWLPDLDNALGRPEWLSDLGSQLDRPGWLNDLTDGIGRPGWLDDLLSFDPLGGLLSAGDEPIESAEDAARATGFNPPGMDPPTLPEGGSGPEAIAPDISLGDTTFDVEVGVDELRDAVDDRVEEVRGEVDRVESELQDLRDELRGRR